MINKVLIVVWDNLGDCIMATDILKPLKRLFPHVKVGFWVKKYVADAFFDEPLIDTVHAADLFWDWAPGQKRGAIVPFLRTQREVAQEGYDVALILNTEWRRSLACFLAKIPRRIGYNRRKAKPFLTESLNLPQETVARFELHYRLLSLLGLKEQCKDADLPHIQSSAEARKSALAWITKKGWADKILIAVHPFSGDPLKCWSIANWFKLVDRIKNMNSHCRFIFIGSKEEIASLYFHTPPLDQIVCQPFVGSLKEVKGVLSSCHLFIGGDSGPGHLAGALRVPVICLFGPTDPLVYAPRGETRISVIKQKAMIDISISQVADQAASFLSEVVTRK